MSRNIYLDFNASTPICQEAVEAMRPFLFEHYGNPSSLHWAGMPQVRVLRDRFWDGLKEIFGEEVLGFLNV